MTRHSSEADRINVAASIHNAVKKATSSEDDKAGASGGSNSKLWCHSSF